MLIACISRPTALQIQKEIEEASSFADLFEIRLDALQEPIEALKRFTKKSLLFTFRKKDEGGVLEIPEKKRQEKIEEALSLEPAYFDIEASTQKEFIEKIAKKYPKTKLIGSYHNFSETPPLLPLFERLQNPHFYALKIALKANSASDFLRLMLFAKEHSKAARLSCISMGEFGRSSRVLGPIVGNFFDYAGLEESFAPLYRYSLKTLYEVYRYPKLNLDTKIYALLGDPVTESIGDTFHNALFEKEGKNSVYIKIKVEKGDLKSVVALIRKLPFQGLSVTMPHKEKILECLDGVDKEALAIGAVNTVFCQGSKWMGTNTDAPGALDAIEKRIEVKGKKMALLGAGGSAKAIAFEAVKRGAILSIYNRTFTKAKKLAKTLTCAAYPLEEFAKQPYEILINTLPFSTDESPVDLEKIDPNAYVLDIIYKPKETAFLKAAIKKGATPIYGEEMFVNQALLQQRIWKNGALA